MALTDAARPTPQAPALSRRQTNIAFATILLGMLLAALDQTIVATALPTIVADLGGAGHVAWVVTAYLLAETISTVLVGKFGDLFGRKIVFQLSAAVFVAGSLLAGIAGDMVMLIAGRAIQGVGAGGLMVTAMALIADVIPLRERGKYQGLLGAVFGVTTVLGPTIGGLFTDYTSWRWCFYINIPLAIVMVAMAVRTLPTVRIDSKPIIDYAGVVLVALGTGGLILALEWGGNEYPWGSTVVIGLLIGSAVLLTAFVLTERRAREPILPLHLFRNPVFTVYSALSFIVGFAMLGAMTYLPTYIQFVDGVSATLSGVRTIPLVAGLLLTSIVSGTIVSRTGRYKYFPVTGTAVMALGLYLMSTMGPSTGVLLESLHMFVLGLGIGLAMQILTIAVQNTVPYHDMGTATSGVTFFRTLGGAFGTAIMGGIYTSRLTADLAQASAQSPDTPLDAVQSPAALHALPPSQQEPFVQAYADALTGVFGWVAPVALVGFAIAWLVKEIPLRDSTRAGATDMGEGFGTPDTADADVQIQRQVATVLRCTPLREKLAVVDGAGTALTHAQAWALTHVHLQEKALGAADVTAIARSHDVPPDVLRPGICAIADAGWLALDGTHVTLTPAGHAELDILRNAWRRWLDSKLGERGLDPRANQARVDRALDRIAHDLLAGETPELTSAAGARGPTA